MIHSLHLHNFKCFEDQSVNIGAVTLLSGLNGQGKSSMLQSLLLLRQSYQQGLLPNTGLALNGDLVSIGTAQDALFEGAKEPEIGFQLNWEDDKIGKWSFKYDQAADVLGLVSSPVQSKIFETSLFNDNFQYLSAERLGPRPSFETSDFLVRRHRQLGARGEYAAYFLTIFANEDISHNALAHPNAVSSNLKSQVEAWIGEISPGTRLDPIPYMGIDLVGLQYSFVTGKQVSRSYRSTNVGFGLTYTLPILVAILSASPGALLLLENPEAHLHPRGQVQIGDLIARAGSCGIQVVVETHSDHILNGIRLAVHDGRIAPERICLHFFERQEQDEQTRSAVISPQIDRNGRIDHWPEGFFDEWDKSLETLLRPGAY